jgi:hypothetical protein
VLHVDVSHYSRKNNQATPAPKSRLDIEFATKSVAGNNAAADRTTNDEDEDKISIDAMNDDRPLKINANQRSVWGHQGMQQQQTHPAYDRKELKDGKNTAD